MHPPSLEILYEDDQLLAVNKAAHLPTMFPDPDHPNLLDLAKCYLADAKTHSKDVYLGAVNRLDAPTTGVVLLGKSPDAVRNLSEQVRERSMRKRYWCVVPGPIVESAGRLVDWVKRDSRHRKVSICQPHEPGSQHAELTYQVQAECEELALLEVELITGRKHQIRVQFAHRGHPIVGDRKYGSKRLFESGIALHSRKIAFDHPVGRERIEVVADTPDVWNSLEIDLSREGR